jgi:deoxyribodipyrimidine photo-lyase
MKTPLNVVWFKRDLRLADHRPLALAAEAGSVLPLYIVEPPLWQQRDASARQWEFAAECVRELQAALAVLGQPLWLMVGDAVAIHVPRQRIWDPGRAPELPFPMPSPRVEA